METNRGGICEFHRADAPSVQEKGLHSALPADVPVLQPAESTSRPTEPKLDDEELFCQLFEQLQGMPFTNGIKEKA